MAIVNKQEIIKRFIEKLRLDPGREAIAMRVGDTLLPVIDISERGEFKHIFDNTANDNDKSFTVPLGHRWEVEFIHTRYVATATAGTRIILFRVLDAVGGNLIYETAGEIRPIASQIEQYIMTFRSGTSDNVSSTHCYGYFPFHVTEGQVIQVLDSVDVDDNDDMTVSISFKEMSMEA